MANNFLMSAGKMTTDIRQFLRDASASGGIKYKAEAGKRHQLYIPFKEIPTQVEGGGTLVAKSIVALQMPIHEFNDKDGKYKAHACIKGFVRKSDDGQTTFNDGSCPICDRLGDAWDVYHWRYQKTVEQSGLTGQALIDYMDGKGNETGMNYKLLDARKAKESKLILFLLVVKFRLNADGTPILESDGNPGFDLKVMRLGGKRTEKIFNSITNSGSEVAGTEIVFDYPNIDDAAQVVGQSTYSVVFPDYMLTRRYPKVLEKINQAVADFDWDGIEKTFPELNCETVDYLKNVMDTSFGAWDKYQAELKVNPNAKYLEYDVANHTQPSLAGAGIGANGIPMPNLGAPVPQAGAPQQFAPQQFANQVAPQQFANTAVPQQFAPQATIPQAPQGVAPQPTMPQAPQGAAPQPTMPQPTMPQPTMPQANPQEGVPQGVAPQPTMPQANPQPTMPQPTMPQAPIGGGITPDAAAAFGGASLQI